MIVPGWYRIGWYSMPEVSVVARSPVRRKNGDYDQVWQALTFDQISTADGRGETTRRRS